MIQAFTDLVGTSAVPALSINIDELTELTPALDTAQATQDMAEQASEAVWSWGNMPLNCPPSTWYSGC